MRLSKFADWAWLKPTFDAPPPDLDFDCGHILVYALVDPRDGSVRYVGVTRNRGRRAEQHAKAKVRGNPGLLRWETELIAQGMAPKMVTLGIADGWTWHYAERGWIEFIESNGYLLYNVTEGGRVKDPKGRGYEKRDQRWRKYQKRKHKAERSARFVKKC